MTAPAAPSAPQTGGTRPRLLDLFCGAGGAGYGYSLAGFDVVGVDLAPQPHYPFPFIQGDAIEYITKHGHEYAAIHSSPPCQAHTAMKTMHNAKAHADLIPATRAALKATGRPYVIENVPGAPLIAPTLLCGTMFDLGVDDAELRRHRIFESSILLLAPSCQHGRRSQCLGVYGGHIRNRRRTIGIYGEGARDSRRKNDRGVADFTVEQGRAAMNCPWMTISELSQAIPPAYTRYIGEQLMRAIEPTTPARTVRKLFSFTKSYATSPALLAESRRQYPDAIAIYANSVTIEAHGLSDVVADDRVPKDVLEVEVEAGTR